MLHFVLHKSFLDKFLTLLPELVCVFLHSGRKDVLIYLFYHCGIRMPHEFGDILLGHSQQKAAAREMVAESVEYKVVVQSVVLLETVPVSGYIVAAEIAHELTA